MRRRSGGLTVRRRRVRCGLEVRGLPSSQELLVIVGLSEFGMNERVAARARAPVVQRANEMQIAYLSPAPGALPSYMRTWEEESNAARPKQREGGRGWEENDRS